MGILDDMNVWKGFSRTLETPTSLNKITNALSGMNSISTAIQATQVLPSAYQNKTMKAIMDYTAQQNKIQNAMFQNNNVQRIADLVAKQNSAISAFSAVRNPILDIIKHQDRFATLTRPQTFTGVRDVFKYQTQYASFFNKVRSLPIGNVSRVNDYFDEIVATIPEDFDIGEVDAEDTKEAVEELNDILENSQTTEDAFTQIVTWLKQNKGSVIFAVVLTFISTLVGILVSNHLSKEISGSSTKEVIEYIDKSVSSAVDTIVTNCNSNSTELNEQLDATVQEIKEVVEEILIESCLINNKDSCTQINKRVRKISKGLTVPLTVDTTMHLAVVVLESSENLIIRSKPSKQSNSKGCIPVGTVVEVVDTVKGRNWSKIDLGINEKGANESGYVHSLYLQKLRWTKVL